MNCLRALIVALVLMSVGACRSDPPAAREEVGRHCEVHGEMLVERKVEVIYGLLIHDYAVALEKDFPHARSHGGCVIMDGAPTTERMLTCTACQKAVDVWSAARR